MILLHIIVHLSVNNEQSRKITFSCSRNEVRFYFCPVALYIPLLVLNEK